MITPCATCPWRVSTCTRDIPGGGMDHARARNMQVAMTQGPFGSTVMQCHLADHACAGFVLKVGYESVGLRLAAVTGVTDPDDYSDGGVELHETFDDMLAAHPPRREPA